MIQPRADRGPIEDRAAEVMQALLPLDERWKTVYETNNVFRFALRTLSATFVRIIDDQLILTSPDLEDLDLTIRAYNVLRREGINNVGQLCTRTRDDLLDMRNMGETGLRSVVDGLARIGLTLKETH